MKNGVSPNDFKLFGEVLIDTMALVLDDDWNEECNKVWYKTYKAVSEAMMKEMNLLLS